MGGGGVGVDGGVMSGGFGGASGGGGEGEGCVGGEGGEGGEGDGGGGEGGGAGHVETEPSVTVRLLMPKVQTSAPLASTPKLDIELVEPTVLL